ncbi:MAG: hypothetical protein JWR12_2978 [Mucilaginibacter sp.]|nr:hypothetical protein [Mucilaginibacter sp.]
MNLRCYIVDDEYHAIEILADYIQRTPGLELAGTSAHPLEALNKITACPPDLVLVDVDMPELNGLELAGLVNVFSTVVFTTSYREYAPEAFEKEAADYLLKPITYERFLQCIQKIRRHRPLETPVSEPFPSFFFVKAGMKGKMIRVVIAEIIYISSALNYIEIHLQGQHILTYLSMAEVLQKLPEEQFSRIHNACIVNHAFIQSIEYAQVKLQNQTTLPVGRAFRQGFRLKMQEFFFSGKRDQADPPG